MQIEIFSGISDDQLNEYDFLDFLDHEPCASSTYIENNINLITGYEEINLNKSFTENEILSMSKTEYIIDRNAICETLNKTENIFETDDKTEILYKTVDENTIICKTANNTEVL